MPPFRGDDVEGARCVHGETPERHCSGTLRKTLGVRYDQGVKPLFTLGRVVVTPGALAAIGVSGDDLSTYLARHQSGDWGDINAHDRRENQISLEQGACIILVCSLPERVLEIIFDDYFKTKNKKRTKLSSFCDSNQARRSAE